MLTFRVSTASALFIAGDRPNLFEKGATVGKLLIVKSCTNCGALSLTNSRTATPILERLLHSFGTEYEGPDASCDIEGTT